MEIETLYLIGFIFSGIGCIIEFLDGNTQAAIWAATATAWALCAYC